MIFWRIPSNGKLLEDAYVIKILDNKEAAIEELCAEELQSASTNTREEIKKFLKNAVYGTIVYRSYT